MTTRKDARPSLSEPPARAGAFTLLAPMGRGHFGAVFQARSDDGREAAVTIFYVGTERDARSLGRAFDTMKAASALGHPNVLPLLDTGTLPDGRAYYASPRLSGMSLERFLARHGRIDVPRALALLQPVASALDALHDAGIVHGCLHTESIFLHYQGGHVTPYLLDTGLSELIAESGVRTVAGVPLGRPFYISPEQVKELDPTPRSDVYSLGAITMEVVAGEPPFATGSALVIRMAHVDGGQRAPSSVCSELPEALDAPILAMLERNPEARPARASEGLRALEAASGQDVPSKLVLPEPAPRAGSEHAPPLLEEPEPRIFTLPASKVVYTQRRRGPKVPWTVVGLLAVMVFVAYWLAKMEQTRKLAHPPAAGAKP